MEGLRMKPFNVEGSLSWKFQNSRLEIGIRKLCERFLGYIKVNILAISRYSTHVRSWTCKSLTCNVLMMLIGWSIFTSHKIETVTAHYFTDECYK